MRMKRRAAALLCCLLALALCGCSLAELLNPPPPEPKPSGRAWSLSAKDTRTARLATGGTDLVWSYTLDMAFFKRGGDTAAGEYEGRLLLYVEADCYEDGVYTPVPPGMEENPPKRGWLLSAMMTLEVAEADGDARRADLAGAADYDRQARAAMEVDAAPGEVLLDIDYGEDEAGEEAAARAALYDCDDYGEPLPDSDAADADVQWRSGKAAVVWQESTGDCGWVQTSGMAAAVTAAAGFEGQPIAASGFVPGWGQYFGGWADGGDTEALPLWVDIAADGVMQVYLPGLAPLEAGRAFEGQMVSGGTIAASLPGPPASSAVELEDESLPEDSAIESEPESTSQKPIWPPMPDSVTEGGEPPAESEPEEPEEPEPDPLELALEKYHLPWPPGGVISGPVAEGDAERFVIEGYDYQAATSYARKLKMGGYKKVLSEVAQPSLDQYSFAAQNGVAQYVSVTYKDGHTELLAFNS